jgi:DNA polymerase III alpha subunit
MDFIVYTNNMKTDNLGRAILEEQEVLECLYNDKDVNSLNVEKVILDQYNKIVSQLKIGKTLKGLEYMDMQSFDAQNQKDWYMPDKFNSIDIESYVLGLAKTSEEIDRVKEELILYKKFGLYSVLRFLIYLIDLMRSNNIVWGVGRGSSVSSYILYLIGVHKVNSILYKLDINDFLR